MAKAILKDYPMSARKVRLVANQVRGLPVAAASERLAFMPKKAAKALKKVLDSAIANAEHNESADIDKLFVSEIFVDGAKMLKRIQPRAKGRAYGILKRRCHVTIKVSPKHVASAA